VALACAGGGEPGPPGSLGSGTKCDQYSLDKARHADIDERYVDGVISLGFKEGPDSRQAAALMHTLETSFYMPLPFAEYALVCVKDGYEDEWVERIQALDWVEYVHREGVRPWMIERDD
jgi:hypothetical protein